MNMEKIDEGIEEVKGMQAWLGHRTEVEREAEELISQCRFEEAMARLAVLDRQAFSVIPQKKSPHG